MIWVLLIAVYVVIGMVTMTAATGMDAWPQYIEAEHLTPSTARGIKVAMVVVWPLCVWWWCWGFAVEIAKQVRRG